jgi:hypothetical protein
VSSFAQVAAIDETVYRDLLLDGNDLPGLAVQAVPEEHLIATTTMKQNQYCPVREPQVHLGLHGSIAGLRGSVCHFSIPYLFDPVWLANDRPLAASALRIGES